MPNLTSQTVDRYEIRELLEQDRIASVYQAYDPKFDRLVTLYLLTAPAPSSVSILQNVRLISTWRHTGLSRLYDFGVFENQDYVVQEYIPSPRLERVLHEMRQADCWLELGEAFQLARELCLILDYVHQRGVAHGDLFPAQIAFRAEPSATLPYQPIILRTGLSVAGESLAPAAYRAPGGGRGGRFTPAADVYALGAILYELVTGQPPTPQSEATSGPAVTLLPHLLHPDLPELLEKTILKCLSPNPADRFKDAGELAAALAGLQDQVAARRSTASGFGGACQVSAYLKKELPKTARLAEPAAFSAPAAAPATPGVDISQDTLYVLMPDKSVRSFALKPGGLTIGRSQDNDVPLDLPGVSRRHVRIDFDGQNYTVRDLGSLNGAFLEQKRLAPEKATLWEPGANLRIGEAWMRIERQAQVRTTQAVISRDLPTQPGQNLPDTDEVFVGPNGETIEASQVARSAGLGWVGAFAATMALSVAPGASGEIPLLLFNRGPAPDAFRISFQGVPLEWIPTPPLPVRVPANSQREIRIAVRPPRSPLVKAGRYGLVIRIQSQNSASQAVELRLTLTISAFSLFASELRPPRIASSENGQVYIHNRGNLPENFTIVWEDRTHTLVFEPPQVKVNLPVSKSAVVEFRPALLQPRLFGQEQAHPFNVNVSSQGGQVETHSGEYFSRGIVPPWAPIAIALVSLSLACVLCLLINQISSPFRRADQTAQGERTELVQATQTAVFQRTATSTSLAGANLATLQAATATAGWLALDSDGDGLINSAELAAGTDPNNPDTDGDGLSDGLEVLTWKTNPLLADTDGDGLKDGVEVERGTNPLLRDTDGDGIEDAVDPDPLHPPTRTPFVFIPTVTARPPSTATLTRTRTPPPSATPQTVDLTISVSNGQSASIPGANTTYTIVVANHGPSPAGNVQIINQFPATLTNVSWTCAAAPGSRCQTSNGLGNVNALVDLAVNGTATLTASGSIAPSATGQLVNTARVNPPPGLIELTPADNQATDADNLTPHAALSLTKTDGRDNVLPGQAVSYTIIVFNNGPSAVPNVRLTDAFPAQLKDISWTCGATAGSSCAVSGVQTGNINHLVHLNPGGSATFTVNAAVRLDASGTISNSAALDSPVDPATNNKTATDATSVTPQVDLELDVSAPISVTASAPLTYTLTITNTGPSIASGLTLTQTLPLTATFVSVTPGGPTCQQAANVVVCQLGGLAAGAQTQVQVVANAPALPGPFESLIEVRANEEDPVPTNNQVEKTVIAN
ncbi:MAG: FHA domain-containing protein [Anaerolineales bacterium]|nr:FHA domain-containing protein [Anaerolineales bacterium]